LAEWPGRDSQHRGLVFRRLLEQIVATGPVCYGELRFGYRRKDQAIELSGQAR